MSEGLAVHMEEVAKILMGDPNPAHSKPGKPRYGNNGSVAIDVAKGAWFDHEAQEGGGVLDLIERMTGNKGRDAIAWMSEQGIRVDDPDTPPRYQDGAGRANSHAERRAEPRAEKSAPEPLQKADKPKREIKATYDYHAPDGTLLYQVVRFEPKGFAQRRPDPQAPGKWIWNLEGIEHTLYRLPELQEPLGTGVVVALVEGEKDADTLTAWGVPATTNSGGAKHWSERHAEHFRGSDVVIIPDNDDAGRAGAEIKAKSLSGIAKRVRIFDLAKVVEGFPHKGDITDWKDQCGGNVDALYKLIAKAPEWKPVDDYRSHFGAVTWNQIEDAGTSYEWLVKGIIARGELAMMAGPSQSGKSFLAIDLAMAIARGVAWRGNKTHQGGVLYCAGESAYGVRRLRLPAYRRHHDCAGENVDFVMMSRAVDLYASDDATNLLIEEAQHWQGRFQHPIQLIVIDTLSSSIVGADENLARDITPVLARCARIRDTLKCAVLLVHHMNALGDKPRGSTALMANVETVILCRMDNDRRDADNRKIREIKIAKQKDGEAEKTWRFVLPAVEIGRDEDGERITSCIVTEPNMGLLNEPPETAQGKGPRLSDKPYNYLLAIKAALDEHGTYASEAGVPLPTGMRVIHKKHVAKAYADRWQGEEEDPAKRDQNMRTARMRLGEKLLAGGYIGSASPWLWLTNKGERVVTPRTREVTENADPSQNTGGDVTQSGGSVTDDWMSQIDDADAGALV